MDQKPQAPEDRLVDEIAGLQESIKIWTANLEQLQIERLVLQQCIPVMQKRYEAVNHENMVALRGLAQKKLIEFEECNRQLLSIHKCLDEKLEQQKV